MSSAEETEDERRSREMGAFAALALGVSAATTPSSKVGDILVFHDTPIERATSLGRTRRLVLPPWQEQILVNNATHEDLELMDVVREGCFGVVYKAKHKPSGAFVAVKLIPNRDNSDLKTVFAHLSKELKQVGGYRPCPYMTDCLECFLKPGHPSEIGIVTEFCTGGTVAGIITTVFDGGYVLREDFIQAVCASVVLGLEQLHLANGIHLSVMARKILITGKGHVKLSFPGTGPAGIDIGEDLGRSNGERRTTVIGSPYHMAPEHVRECQYDGKADIWSLGCAVIEMAQGAPPRADLHPLRAIFLIPTKDPPKLSDPQMWSSDMDDFVTSCCQKDPNQRPDAASLSAHPFIKRDVEILKAMHGSARRAPSSVEAKYAMISHTGDGIYQSNAPVGLPAVGETLEQVKVLRASTVSRYVDPS